MREPSPCLAMGSFPVRPAPWVAKSPRAGMITSSSILASEPWSHFCHLMGDEAKNRGLCLRAARRLQYVGGPLGHSGRIGYSAGDPEGSAESLRKKDRLVLLTGASLSAQEVRQESGYRISAPRGAVL